MTRARYLSLECLTLFGLIPGGLVLLRLRGGFSFFPVLLGLCAFTLLLGARDPQVAFRIAHSWARAKKRLPHLLLRVGAAAVILTALTAWLFPPLLFRFPRENPQTWALVMVLYPLLSVAPQEYLFRSFFMQRYRPLFGNGRIMLWVNALAFGWAHAFFLNVWAPALSVAAGLLLAHTWQNTRNFRAVCLEHALYGHIVFTCGMGWFFYHGTTRTLQEVLSP